MKSEKCENALNVCGSSVRHPQTIIMTSDPSHMLNMSGYIRIDCPQIKDKFFFENFQSPNA